MKRTTIVPTHLVVVLLLASCSQSARVPDAAERADRLNDAKTEASELLGAGEYHRAARVLESLSEEASGDHQVFVMLGDAYARIDRYDDAVAAYESALRLAYSNHEAHLKLATLLMEHGRVGRALTEFDLAIRYGDREPLTHYNYGLALREMGRQEDALAEWRRAHEMDPGDPRFAEAVGIGLAGVDDTAAVEHFERAGALGAADASFHNNYGLALQRLGRTAEAADQFRAAIQRAGDVEEYRFNLAALYTNAGWHEDAIHVWRALIDARGTRWSYLVYLARSQQSLGRHREAIDTLEEAALARAAGEPDAPVVDREPPYLHQALEVVALARRAVGDLGVALERIREAVELAPDNPVYRNNYGVMLAESGMLDEARAQWRKVLKIDEDNAAARENLSRFGP
jgi:Flp pilus assembly protein TadD